MEKKKVSMSTFLIIVGIIVIGVLSCYLVILMQNKSNVELEKKQLEDDMVKMQEQVQTLQKENKELQDKVSSITNVIEENKTDISFDKEELLEKIYPIIYLKDFEKLEDLSDKECLDAVYTAINRGNSIKDKYTVEEINSYLQKLFNKQNIYNDSENGGLTYENGKYKFVGADGEPLPKIKNASFEVKDDNVYVKLDLYKVDVSDEETFVGKYTVTFEQDTATKQLYITSKVKE